MDNMVDTALRSRTAQLAVNITRMNAMMEVLRNLPPAPPPSLRTRFRWWLGGQFMKMANHLGVYSDEDADDWADDDDEDYPEQ